jgi:hypothetical protein
VDVDLVEDRRNDAEPERMPAPVPEGTAEPSTRLPN